MLNPLRIQIASSLQLVFDHFLSEAIAKMVKDSEIPIKKRRKAVATGGEANSAGELPVTSKTEVPSKPENVDMYQSIIDYETREALARDPDEDHALYSKTCNDFRKITFEIAKLKAQKSEKAKAEIAELRTQGALLFVVLKKLNRLEKFRTQHSREILNKVKQQVDSDYLQLQNLNYEMLHLKMEVNKCLKFKSKDEEIELVPVSEFYKEAPASISRAEVTEKDEHQLKLARLEWELQQRKDISAQCQELEEKRRAADKEIVAQSARLDNLRPQLDEILAATAPLQDFFDLPLDKGRRLHTLARMLPTPLYIVYVRADSYKKACDPTANIAVRGDEDAARCLATDIQPAVDDESDSEQENQQAQDEECGRRRKASTRADRQAERRALLLQAHPLAVEVTLRLADGSSIRLTFTHLTNLSVVMVTPKVEPTHAVHGVAAAELIAPHRILSVLLPGTLGEAVCEAATSSRLRRAGLDDLPGDLGLPYVWAQRLAGKESVTYGDVAIGSETLFRRIKRRLESKLSLCQQIQQLESGQVLVSQPMRSLFPGKLGSVLREFTPLVWEDYMRFPHTSNLIEEDVSQQSDTFYKAVLARGTAKLTALVTVKADYPAAQAVFCLQVHWLKELTARNCNAIRDMERELNVYSGECPSTLSAQVMRLQSLFDIFLEASSSMSSGDTDLELVEFPRDKVFFRAVRGRDRAMPFKYLQAGGGVFTHR